MWKKGGATVARVAQRSRQAITEASAVSVRLVVTLLAAAFFVGGLVAQVNMNRSEIERTKQDIRRLEGLSETLGQLAVIGEEQRRELTRRADAIEARVFGKSAVDRFGQPEVGQ